MPQRGIKRDRETAVRVSRDLPLFYQFATKNFVGLSDSDLAVIGHIRLRDSGASLPSGSILLIRCNAPTPPRVTLKTRDSTGNLTGNTVSTFCDVTKVRDALEAGWRIAKPGLSTGVGRTNKSVIAAAELSNGLFYVFPITIADYDQYAEALGLVSSAEINTAAERARLIRGCSAPRPGQAKLVFPNGSTLTSFYGKDASLDGGFQKISDEILT
jgi:hypothetical protein